MTRSFPTPVAVLLAAIIIHFSAHSEAAAQSPTDSGMTIGQMASRLNPANWTMPKLRMPKMPSLLPGQEDRTRIVKKRDNLLTDVSDTAKRSWQRTKETLNPARLNPMNLFAGNSDTPASTNTPKKPGFFSSLFAPPEPQERVASVSDWLKQERPR